MESLKNYVKNYINNYINESIWDIEDNVEDDNEEMIKTEIYEFLDECYFCEERFDFKQPSQIVQIIPDKTQFIVNCHCSVHTANDITVLTNGLFEWGEVKGDFNCSGSLKLESLEGSPETVRGNFNCTNCPNLKSLEGASEKVDGDFYCTNCAKLTSLKGAPEKVELDFRCTDCPNLHSLDGIGEVGLMIVSDIN